MQTKQAGPAVTPRTGHLRISACMLFILTGLSYFSAVALVDTAISSVPLPSRPFPIPRP